jgi:DME family drug/metabolite transporter
VLWATVGVASKFVPYELSVPDEVYGFARTIVAGPVILLIAAISNGWKGCIPRSCNLPHFFLFGICCAIFQVCLFRSFWLLGVTVTVFLTVCLPPALFMIWTLWRRTEQVSGQVVTALVLAALGLLSFVGDDINGNALSTLLGLALSVLASIAFVGLTQTARLLTLDHSAFLVSGLGLVITAALLAPACFLLAPGNWQLTKAFVADWRSLSVLIYLGLGPTALAYVCYCVGMARCRSASAGLVASMIEPVVAAGLAFVFLRETLTSWQSLGCVVMLVAMIVLWIGENRSSSIDAASSADAGECVQPRHLNREAFAAGDACVDTPT